MHTNLKQADFYECSELQHDIQHNTLTNASFSFPDVIGLLNHLNIKITGWPEDFES